MGLLPAILAALELISPTQPLYPNNGAGDSRSTLETLTLRARARHRITSPILTALDRPAFGCRFSRLCARFLLT